MTPPTSNASHSAPLLHASTMSSSLPITPSRPVGTPGSLTSIAPQVRAAVPSPAYRTKSRHSLYGVEDRIVIDPGSSVWKVGFSGEPKPRAVFWAGDEGGASGIWEEEFEGIAERDGWGEERGLEGKREWGEGVVETCIGDRLREVFSKCVLSFALPRSACFLVQLTERTVTCRHLMTDPKSRKVIVLENPLLPTRIKEMIARCLFEDLQVRVLLTNLSDFQG